MERPNRLHEANPQGPLPFWNQSREWEWQESPGIGATRGRLRIGGRLKLGGSHGFCQSCCPMQRKRRNPRLLPSSSLPISCQHHPLTFETSQRQDAAGAGGMCLGMRPMGPFSLIQSWAQRMRGLELTAIRSWTAHTPIFHFSVATQSSFPHQRAISQSKKSGTLELMW